MNVSAPKTPGVTTTRADGSAVSPPPSQPLLTSASGATGDGPPTPPPACQEQVLVPVPKGRRPHPVVWAIILVVLASATTAYVLSGGDRQSTGDAYLDGRAVRVSPKVSGQVMALHVEDNVFVKEGDVLLEIDPADYQAKVDQASAAVATAARAVEQTKAAVLRAQAAVGEAEAAARAAGSEAHRRASDYRRYAAMGTDGISEQQLETAKDAADTANDQREAAAKKQAAAEAELNVAHVNVKVAESQLAAAKAQLHLAELQLQYTKVVAGVSGYVTSKNVEAGAFVSTGQPLLAIVPEERWVLANFKEVQLQKMRVGQRAEVRVDAYPSLRLRGRVQSMQAGTGSRFQLLPPENATGNWVKVVQRLPVKIVFEPDQPGLAQLAQGMSVEVTVDTGDPPGIPAAYPGDPHRSAEQP